MEKFGKILKEKRLEKHFSLKEVSERTKIRVNILEAIENGHDSGLPPIYFNSFLRTYTDFLGVSPDLIPKDDVAIKKLQDEVTIDASKPKLRKIGLIFHDEGDGDAPNSDSYDLEASNERPNPIANIAIYVSVALIVIASIYFGLLQTVFDIKKDTNIVAFDESSALSDTAIIGNSETSLFKDIKPPEPDSITLQAKASGEAWIRILIDGKKAEEVYMRTGMQKKWVAKDYFELTQGNVGAVVYYRNNQLLEPFGAKGSIVRNVKITKTQLFNTTKSEQDSIKQLYFKPKQPKKQEVKEEPIIIEPTNFDENFIKNNQEKKKFTR